MRYARSFEGVENATKQSFKDECDVNRIVRQFTKTGIVNHLSRGTPQYGEVPELSLHEAACISAEIASKGEEGFFDEKPPVTPTEGENPSEDATEAPTEASESNSPDNPESQEDPD